jgi:hypothetical protein
VGRPSGVQATLRLAVLAPPDSLGAAGTATRANFTATMAADIAAALGVAGDRVSTVIMAGLDAAVAPLRRQRHPSGRAGQAAGWVDAHTGRSTQQDAGSANGNFVPAAALVTLHPAPPLEPPEPTVAQLVAALQVLLADPNSVLFLGTASRYLQATVAGAPPPDLQYDAAPGTGFIVDGPLEHSVALSSQASLAWTVVGEYVTLEVTLAHAGLPPGLGANVSLCSNGTGPANASSIGAGPGWFGLAINREARMAGGDGIVVEPARDAGDRVHRVAVNSMLIGGVVRLANDATAASGGPALITDDAHVRTCDGTLVARFARSLAPAVGADAGASQAAPPGSEIILTWAHGNAGQGAMGMHGRDQSGALAVVLATGAARGLELPPPLIRIIHSSVMAAAVGILLPVGILLARYHSKSHERKSGGDEPDGVLFRIHIVVSVLAVLMAGGAYGLGVWMTPPGAHFATWHAVLGHVLVGALLLQVCLSMPCCRPPRAHLGNVMTVGRGLWQLAHLLLGYPAAALGVAVIVTGMMVMRAGVVYYVVYGLVVAELLGYTAYQECGRRWCFCCLRSWRKVCCGCCVCYEGSDAGSVAASRRASAVSAHGGDRRGSTTSVATADGAGADAYRQRYGTDAAAGGLPPGVGPYGYGPTAAGPGGAAGMGSRGDALGAYYLDADEIDPALAAYLRAGGAMAGAGYPGGGRVGGGQPGYYDGGGPAPPPSAMSAAGFTPATGGASASVYSGASWHVPAAGGGANLQVADEQSGLSRRSGVTHGSQQTPRSDVHGAGATRGASAVGGRASQGGEDLRDSLRGAAPSTLAAGGAAAVPGTPLAAPGLHGVDGGEPKPITVMPWSAIWRRFVESPLASAPGSTPPPGTAAAAGISGGAAQAAGARPAGSAGLSSAASEQRLRSGAPSVGTASAAARSSSAAPAARASARATGTARAAGTSQAVTPLTSPAPRGSNGAPSAGGAGSAATPSTAGSW